MSHQSVERTRRAGTRRSSSQAAAQNVELLSLGLIHDLCSPLSAAASAFGVLDVLLGQGDEQTRFFRETVRRSLHDASDRIDGWRRLVAIGATGNRRSAVPLQRLAADVLDELGTSRTGERVIVDRLPVVLARPEQIRLVLRNLIDNSRRYKRTDVPLDIAIGSEPWGSCHRIFVRDNGRGIPAAYRTRVLEPFRRVPGSPGHGLGLGLQLVKRIIEQHGGHVWLESRLGLGTTVNFTLEAPHRESPLRPHLSVGQRTERRRVGRDQSLHAAKSNG